MENVHALVISAHPDDAEFGAAGAVARWTNEGQRVVYVVCTKGEKGTGDRSIASAQLAKIRVEEQRKAALEVGVETVVFMDYPDQGLEETPEFRKRIVAEIRRFRPEVVVATDPYRRYIWHRDHRILGQVVLDAAYPYARDHLAYPDLLEQGLEPHKVRRLMFWGAEEINYKVDITDFFDRKLAALRCHESQFRESGFSEIKSRVEKMCRETAKGEPFDLAEAFHLVVIDR